MALVCDIKSNPDEDTNPQKLEDDLEDGEIEDDDEEAPAEVQEPPKIEPAPPVQAPIVESPKKPDSIENKPNLVEKVEKHRDRPDRDRRRHEEKARREDKTHRHMTEAEKSILHLRKREKMLREREKWEKTHHRKEITDPLDDDFAKNIEKTLATILNKKEKEAAAASGGEEKGDEKRGKKRKKHEKDRSKKKRIIESPKSEIDENEMLNMRGGSPEQKMNPKEERSPSHSDQSYDSEYSTDQSERSKRKDGKKEGRRNREHHKEKNRRERERKNNEQKLQDSQGVCVFYMQGKCQKNDCPYSHEANPPMKLELCKFYLMDCCAKGEKCSYMHSEFPCKFYHTGLPCSQGIDCKFSHGKSLTEGLKQILFKHIETAPRDILGGFPRMSREEALNMINMTQKKLQDQFGVPEEKEDTVSKGGIPSLFDINVPVPPELMQGSDVLDNKNQGKLDKPGRNRPSRWQDPDPTPAGGFPLKPFNYGQDQDMRINSNGDIDMRTLPPSLSTITTQASGPSIVSENSSETLDLEQYKREAGIINSQDIDIRSGNLLSTFNAQDIDIRAQTADPRYLSTKDVDIRQLSNVFNEKIKDNDAEDEPMLQIDTGDDRTKDFCPDLSQTTRDLFARIRAQQKEIVVESQPQERFDMDITDINWYSDDDDEDENRLTIKVEEDEKVKDKEEVQEEEFSTSKSETMISPPLIKPLDVVEKLGDLSKIDISAEVTKLLTTMSQNRQQLSIFNNLSSIPLETPPLVSPQDLKSTRQDSRAFGMLQETRPDPRLTSDPRQRSRQSSTETVEKKPEKLSIYEQGSIDLKTADDIEIDDFKGSLRPDIDLRNLSLPFKGMQNYTPATEIDASINSHPPMPWKVSTVDIPRPDYTGLKLSINDAEKTGDPRLRKIFRLSVEEKDSPMSPKASPKASATARVDPRLRKTEEKPDTQMSYTQQLNMLQSSAFYQSLTSNQKVLLNQELANRYDHSNSHDPVLNSLLSNLNLIPGPNVQGNQSLGTALSIISSVTKINPILSQNNPGNVLNQPPLMVQPGLLGAAPGIPNLPPDFPINFDPRNGGLLGNAPPVAFGGNFPPVDAGFGNFNDDFFVPEGNFGHNSRDNRGFNNNNRDRRRGRNFNNRNRNFRNNNRNNHRSNRNHSPP